MLKCGLELLSTRRLCDVPYGENMRVREASFGHELVVSSMLMNQQYILNMVTLIRNKSCID